MVSTATRPRSRLTLRSLVCRAVAALKWNERLRQVIRCSTFIPPSQTFASSFAYSYWKGLTSPEDLS